MAPASSSPSSRAYNSREASPSPRPMPLSRIPSVQRVNTSLPQQFSVTPASAQSSSSVNHSPYFGSIQSSPLSTQYLNSQSHLASPDYFKLPESVAPPSMGTGASKESINSQKSGSLMRKLSQSAKDSVNNTVNNTRQILRRKTSTTGSYRRDESTGPIARRRSDSKTNTTNGTLLDQSILDTLPTDLNTGLGVYDAQSITSEPTTVSDPSPEGVAPTIPEVLVCGSPLVKITKNGVQTKLFSLDPEGSRVTWRGAVSNKTFHIDNIKSIRTGREAAIFKQEFRGVPIDPDLCFTVNYATSDSSKRSKALHLATKTRDELKIWVDTLESLAKHREALMTSMVGTEREAVIRTHWDNEIQRQISKSGEGSSDGLDLPAIQSLCTRLHIHCHIKDLEHNFRVADIRQSGKLDYDQFKEFLRRLRDRQDIRRVFDSLRDTTNGITRLRFIDFLSQTQGIDMEDEAIKPSWEETINRLMGSLSNGTYASDEPETPVIGFSSFASFIGSKDSYIYASPEQMVVKLDRPLNEYFISSSHNTYLTGWQVNGTSSAEAYVTALRHGCRSVEVDCWDGQDGNPRVTHGHTRTSAVLFSDCISAISRCAFDASPYPLIISLEVHCNPEQQKKMVNIMIDTFGDRLLLHPLPEHTTTLPTPEQLKYKILIKVKATELHPDLIACREESGLLRKQLTNSPYRKPTAPGNANPPSMPMLPNPAVMSPPETVCSPMERSAAATSASSAGEESDSAPVRDSPPKSQEASKVTAYLSSLGVYAQGYRLRVPKDLLFQLYNHIFSLNENRAMDLCRAPEVKAMFEDHNVNHLCRVYPKTFRFESSNFDPNTFWRRGVQMVALNWQTYDVHMQMNQAMFAAGTDQYGYVLKPDYLRCPRPLSGDVELRNKLKRQGIAFSVNVISAQQLPRPQNVGKGDSLNPSIEVQIFSAEDKAYSIANGTSGRELSSANGLHGLSSSYRRRTNVVLGNGYNPQFNEKIELYLETKYPELVFVRFIVYHCPDGRTYGKSNKQVAVFTAKLSSLQRGYRHIPLYNGNGEEFIFSTLFCKIDQPVYMSPPVHDFAERTPRQNLFRGILSRGLSGDRGRERSSSIEDQWSARQVMVNREIRERVTKQ